MRAFRLRSFVLAGLCAAGLIGVYITGAQGPPRPLDEEKIIHYVRQRFTIPDSVKITMTDPRASAYPDFLETTVTLDDGKEKRSQPLFLSKNMRYLVEGSIFNLAGDPREEIVRLISLQDQPTQGPAGAPVTLVEYSDLECPICAQLHQELETDIIPKYGDKLRVVFKEFPLVTIHDWALAGAMTAQCAYRIDPEKYVAFRTAVFKNQAGVTGDHAHDMLLHFGAEAGIDYNKLASCVDAKQSLPRIDANIQEGDALGVGQTPTSFINGRIVVGAPPAAEFDKMIDEAMRDPK